MQPVDSQHLKEEIRELQGIIKRNNGRCLCTKLGLINDFEIDNGAAINFNLLKLNYAKVE